VHQADSGPSAAVQEPGEGVAWEIRPYREGDIHAIVALINTVDEAYKLREGTSEDDLRISLSAPRQEPERQIVVAEGPRVEGVPEGMLLGYGRVGYDDDEANNARIYYVRVVIHPAAEGMGLDRTIAARLLDIIRGYEADPALKRMEKVRVNAWLREELAHARTLWKGLGLKEVRWFWTMERPLHEPIDEPQPIDGVTVRLYNRPDDNEPARIAFNDSFSDHWDHHDAPADDWDYWMSTPNVRPDLSWLAESEKEPGRIVGFCMCAIFEEDNKRMGVREGWIELLGTTRDARRKGLGRSLLLHGLHSLRSAGMDTALLGVDSLSLTGANRLYESVGFRIRNREVQYECLLEDLKI
jgi:mycothiol synthase